METEDMDTEGCKIICTEDRTMSLRFCPLSLDAATEKEEQAKRKQCRQYQAGYEKSIADSLPVIHTTLLGTSIAARQEGREEVASAILFIVEHPKREWAYYTVREIVEYCKSQVKKKVADEQQE